MSSPFTSITKLAGTRVLVIGGTSGIGFAVAATALEHGASVIVASSQPSKVDAATQRLCERYPAEYSARIAGFACDLGNQDTVEGNVVELLEKATSPDTFPSGNDNDTEATEGTAKIPLDHIAFTAGDLAPLHLSLSTLTVPALHQSNNVRFLGALFVAKHAHAYMRVSSASSLTLTSGTNTKKPGKGWTVQAGLGAAIEGAARGMAVDLAPVRVNTVSPGAVFTELVEKAMGERQDEALRTMGEATLVGAVGRAQDVAEAYVYCMKDGFVDGLELGSDGGRLLK
jgi:NAD(P)-dependent dehydrogenase (short-subunit alcohol dehydrogenase family)